MATFKTFLIQSFRCLSRKMFRDFTMPSEILLLSRFTNLHYFRLLFKIPRVVLQQKDKFEEEDIFKKHSRDGEVRYTLYRDRPAHERQAKFQAGCRDGHTEIVSNFEGSVPTISQFEGITPIGSQFEGIVPTFIEYQFET